MHIAATNLQFNEKIISQVCSTVRKILAAVVLTLTLATLVQCLGYIMMLLNFWPILSPIFPGCIEKNPMYSKNFAFKMVHEPR